MNYTVIITIQGSILAVMTLLPITLFFLGWRLLIRYADHELEDVGYCFTGLVAVFYGAQFTIVILGSWVVLLINCLGGTA